MDDESNVAAVGTLNRGARVECRIVSVPSMNPMVSARYATQWLLIKGDMVVEIDHEQALVLGMMEEEEE